MRLLRSNHTRVDLLREMLCRNRRVFGGCLPKLKSMKIAKIDVTKVEKSRLFDGKNGAKYLDIVLHENKDGTDQYGNDGFITQGCSQEERQSGLKMPIIGNWKRVGGKKAEAKPKATEKTAPNDGDDIPF